MERATQEITTEGGHILVLKSYITGGESRELQKVFFEGMSIEMNGDGSAKMPSMNPAVSMKAQDKAVELLAISFDGSSENILPRILDLPKAECDEVLKAIDAVSNGLDHEKKA